MSAQDIVASTARFTTTRRALLAIFGLLWSMLHFGRGMLVHLDEGHMPPFSTSLSDIPYYAGRRVLRMSIAFA